MKKVNAGIDAAMEANSHSEMMNMPMKLTQQKKDENAINDKQEKDEEATNSLYLSGNADEMAKHISLNGEQKTEYAKERLTEVQQGGKMSEHWMEQIDMIDPGIS